jgi:hypothetical protein
MTASVSGVRVLLCDKANEVERDSLLNTRNAATRMLKNVKALSTMSRITPFRVAESLLALDMSDIAMGIKKSSTGGDKDSTCVVVLFTDRLTS